MDPLTATLETLPGVNADRLAQLHRLGLQTVADLLFHLPRAYEDLTDVRDIAKISADKPQTVRGKVVDVAGKALGDGRTVASVVISDDGKHILEGTWFNQPFAARRFRYGQLLSFSGKPKWYRDHWQMSNPRVQFVAGETTTGPGVLPVYPLTEDLYLENLRPLIRRALDAAAPLLVDVLPDELRNLRGLPSVIEAIRDVHFPAALGDALVGRQRFIYEEFLVLQLALALRRRELRDRRRAPPLTTTSEIDARIRRLFPFDLTADQDKAVADLRRDLASDRPMQRLLQADVGAGKTAVAVYALLVAVANKHQAALMAPTEVLARQHFHTIERYLVRSRVRRLLLTGGSTAKERTSALAALASGEIDLVIGTQALVQEDVRFARLGLVVIDEQHKFGVNQRAQIRKRGVDPHYLIMTATPIPRTVALTVFGDLDVSIIEEMPPGRQPVKTRWIEEKKREWAYQQIRKGLKLGQQVFVVCPVVEEGTDPDLKSATQMQETLQAGPFHDFPVGLLHGRMDEDVKAAVMARFRAREIQVLVCTTAIEVGVDVPNATMLVIEHAERFGLSQLHQLRGRVGRGKVAGECFLFAAPASEDARQRLRTFARTRDGFVLAEEDMKQRGIGEFFGARQHGLNELRFGDLTADADLLRTARADAVTLVADDPGLSRPEHRLLRAEVLRRYGKTLELAEVG